jgi:hypothetical protein
MTFPARHLISHILLIGIVLAAAPVAAFADTALVPAGSTWKYLDDGSDQGTAWQAPGFDDAGWSSGPAQLGYGDGDEATVVGYGTNPSNKYITTYFRHSFEVPDPGAFPCMKLELLRDDGAVVYLNASEVARSNMPDGAVDYLTPAASTVGSTDEDTFFEYYFLPGDLVGGTNVLAVEIHQVSGTSSDISLDLALTGLDAMPELMRKAPYLTYPGTNTEMDVRWQLLLEDTCTLEWGLDTSYGLGSVETAEYGVDHQHAHTITGLVPGTVYFYRVTQGTAQHTGTFRAAPADHETSVKFFAYGDTRTYPEDHNAVASDVVAAFTADPEFHTFLACVGDLVTDGDSETDWDTEFFDPSYTGLKTMLACLAYQSAMGNHEESGVLFAKYFPYPFVGGRYWSFDYGPCHFAVVDQYTAYGPGSDQLIWLEGDLASTSKPWKFVYLHEPGWSAGGHANNPSVQDYIQPICETHDVAIVFAGHNHYYARAIVNDVQHITTGGGGAPLYTPNLTYPNVVTGSKSYHYCAVEIDGGILHLEAVDTTSAVIDSFTIALAGAAVERQDEGAKQSSIAFSPAPRNPYVPGSQIGLNVPTSAHLNLDVFDVQGRRVRNLLSRILPQGHHSIAWDGTDDMGRDVPPGLYYLRLDDGRQQVTGAIVLAR